MATFDLPATPTSGDVTGQAPGVGTGLGRRVQHITRIRLGIRPSGALMSWAALFGAIVLDVAATYALTASRGFRDVVPAGLGVGGFGLSIYLFGVALDRIGPSVSYAMFGAVGTAAVAVIGMTVGGETVTWGRVGALALIVLGVTLLPLAGPH